MDNHPGKYQLGYVSKCNRGKRQYLVMHRHTNTDTDRTSMGSGYQSEHRKRFQTGFPDYVLVDSSIIIGILFIFQEEMI